MTKIFPLVLAAVFFNSLGQVLFKKASNLCGPTHLIGARAYLDFFKKVTAMPWIWMGLGLMSVGLLTWLLAISQADLSYVYPLGSLYYVFIFILARLFLGESLSRTKFTGVLLIGLGIILITRS